MNTLHKIIIVCVLFVIGCGSLGVRTRAYTYKDPMFASRSLKKVMVFANTGNLQDRDKIENKFIKYIARRNYDCLVVKSTDIVLPTRTYTEIELKQLLKSNNIDALLIFDVQTAGYDHQKFTYNQPYQTYGNIYKSGSNMYSYNTQTYGGPQTYDFYKPYLGALADIYDVSTEMKIWTAQIYSGGNAFTNINDTLDDAIKTTVLKMEKDGLIKVKQK